MSMMLCAKCGEYYDPVQYCYECDPFESAKNQELARKDAEIARLTDANNENMMKAMERETRLRAALERCRDYFSDSLTVDEIALSGKDWGNKAMERMCAEALEAKR